MSFSGFLRSRLASAAVFAMISVTPLQAQEAKVLATVDAHQITDRDVEFAKNTLGDALKQMPADQQRPFILNLLVESHLLADAARKAGLADTEEYKRQLTWLEAQALREAFVRKRAAELVSDADIKTRYDEAKAQVAGKKEVQASHILLKTEEEAKAVIAELDKGADFAELAKAKSTGPSGPRGGDLGFFGEGRMVPEFEKVVFPMEKGTYTKTPVKTQFGFHVIKKVTERELSFPELKDVSDRIRAGLQADKLQIIVKELREKAKVEIKQP
jgi:peptidyl-prolyl cis-trans isomerase C